MVAREFVEDLDALGLRREHAVGGVFFLELDDAVLQHAGGMEDAVQIAEFFARARRARFGARRGR